MSKISVLDIDGKEIEQIDLPENIFDKKINTDVIYQAVVMYLASLRQGNAATKQRGDVSGGGKKPYRQKGTGRARHGSSRSPLWRGGGVIFGPHPRNFNYTVPKKIRNAALCETLNAKYQQSDIYCLVDIKQILLKTKEFVKILKNLTINVSTLAILEGCDGSIEQVTRNIPYLQLMRAKDINAYDILKHKKILVTKTALVQLLERITK